MGCYDKNVVNVAAYIIPGWGGRACVRACARARVCVCVCVCVCGAEQTGTPVRLQT